MQCHGECKQDKAICLFAPSQMKKERPECIQCMKKRGQENKRRWRGKPLNAEGGRSYWSRSMVLHFPRSKSL